MVQSWRVDNNDMRELVMVTIPNVSIQMFNDPVQAGEIDFVHDV